MYQDHLYTDEPLQISPETKDRLTPVEYAQMKKLDFSSPFAFRMDARVFYLQAKFMENFEDHYDYQGEFECYYPTYRSMTTSEMRGYFSWRTDLRKGNLYRTSLSFAFVYCYELLHCIGSRDPVEGFQKLIAFYDDYGALAPTIQKYLKPWIKDFVIYYQLDPILLKDRFDFAFDEAVNTLFHIAETDDSALFDALLQLSNYHLEKSILMKKYAAEVKELTCRIYRALDQKSMQEDKIPFLKKYFRYTTPWQYTLFQSAVFYNHLNITDTTYNLSPVQTYTCHNKRWQMSVPYLKQQKEEHIGSILHCIDRLLRRKYQLNSLKPNKLEKLYEEVIKEEIRKPVMHKEEVHFDLSLLDQIRRTADETSQKIMTEEEKVQDEIIAPVMKEETGYGLTSDQYAILKKLLYGGDIKTDLAQKHLMLSVVIDAINETLFDTFSDTVIDFDGMHANIIEDYIEDLKGMIPNENT